MYNNEAPKFLAFLFFLNINMHWHVLSTQNLLFHRFEHLSQGHHTLGILNGLHEASTWTFLFHSPFDVAGRLSAHKGMTRQVEL